MPVFGLALLGYLAARLGWFSEQMASGLARFVFDYAVPLLLVRVLASAQLPDTPPLQLWLSFYVPLFTIYALGMLVSRRVFGRDFMGQTITGFGCAFGNTILLGLPLVLLAFGDAGALPFFLLISVHGLLIFTLTTVLLELGRNRQTSLARIPLQVGKSLLTNPIMLGIFAGLALNWTGYNLPGPVDRIAEYMQQAVTPCALFSLGASLNRYGFAGQLKQTLFVTAMKNLVLPAAVWLVAGVVFELPALWVMVAVLTAAQPCGVNFYLFAQRYEVGSALATSSVFVSTVLSMFTLSLLLYLFHL